MNITKDTLISDILKAFPKSKEVFERNKMGCFSCMGVQNETLEKGCLMHGLEVNVLIEELEVVKK